MADRAAVERAAAALGRVALVPLARAIAAARVVMTATSAQAAVAALQLSAETARRAPEVREGPVRHHLLAAAALLMLAAVVVPPSTAARLAVADQAEAVPLALDHLARQTTEQPEP